LNEVLPPCRNIRSIVTGAASGIGLGIATTLAEAGANVVMADIEKDAVEQAANQLSGTNKQVLPVRIDVTQEQSVIHALAEAERRFGKLRDPLGDAEVTREIREAAEALGISILDHVHARLHKNTGLYYAPCVRSSARCIRAFRNAEGVIFVRSGLNATSIHSVRRPEPVPVSDVDGAKGGSLPGDADDRRPSPGCSPVNGRGFGPSL
jgi:short-subunit dehydrogenase involved in D-alanine esterification of teichoic acids